MAEQRDAPTDTPAPSLLIRHPDARETLVPLTFESAIIGRGAEADIRLDHPMVSRKHAQLSREPDGRLVLSDLGSRNGTVVNGRAVPTRVLEPGDLITLGPFTLEIQIPSFAGEGLTTHHTRVQVSDAAAGRIDTLSDVEQPRVHATHLMMLNDFAQRLLATESAGERQRALCELLSGEHFHGRWAAILRVEAEREDDAALLLCECHCEPRRSHSQSHPGNREQPYLSRSVLRAVRTKGQAVIASNVAPQIDLQVSIAPSVMSLAAVASPLSRTATHIDLLYVVLPPEYGTGEWLAMAVMAGKQYTSAENAWAARRQAEAHAAVQRDLQRARDIQMRLVPRDPQISGLDLAIGFSPCRYVGGDYVDVVKVPSTSGGRPKVLLAVADVCGKGLPAALTSSSLHTSIHLGVLGLTGLCPMMNNLNQYLRSVLPDETFVTMAAVLLDPATGQLEYVNAGHPPPLILTAGRPPVQLEKTENLPLRLDEVEFVGRTLTLEPGQLLVLYTDGLTEIEVAEGKLLGISGLAGELGGLYSSSATGTREVSAALSRRLGELQGGGEAEDDQTFLLAKRI